MATEPVLLWLREDLRFDDNPAMRAAADTGRPVICLYILDEETPGDLAIGCAQRWWLHHSLCAFREDLEKRGGALVLRRGDPRKIVPGLAGEIGAPHVFWTRRYMGWQTDTDSEIKQALKDAGHDAQSFNGQMLYEPWTVETKAGDPYRVFTPYWKNLQAKDDLRDPVPRVDKLEAPADIPSSDELADWDLLPAKPDWATGFEPVWTPGEKGARARLRDWLSRDAARYKDERNRPDLDTTSRLSPHLHFGELSPLHIWQEVKAAVDASDIPGAQAQTFLSEVAWREFSYHLLYYQPQMTEEPLNAKFSDFKWDTNKKALRAWQKGQTGYPIVDAGMRQLWAEGWMHNRVRMIVASFLIKDLFIHWREGMLWFWDTLLDADPANNTASWQWVAGCGADAAPYFRVFNPTTQGEKFDPEGEYIRKYVPELAGLSADHIHAPSDAPPFALRDAKIEIGTTYPEPIVNHKDRREEALRRYEQIK